MKRISSPLNSSSSAKSNSGSGIHQLSRSSRHKWISGFQSQRSSMLVCGRNRRGDGPDRIHQAPSRAARVVDDDGNDATPLGLFHAEPRDTQSKPGRLFLDGMIFSTGPDQSKSTSSFKVLFSSSRIDSSFPSSLSVKGSGTRKTEESLLEQDRNANLPAPCEVPKKRDDVKQHVTEKMLDEVEYILLSETDTITLLDIPNTFILENADGADERNIHYVELRKNKTGNEGTVDQSVQSLTEVPKNKQIQSDTVIMFDTGTVATVWDIYDSISGSDQAVHPECVVSTTKGREKRAEASSSWDTDSTINSLMEMSGAMCGNSLDAEPNREDIMLSESFKKSLLVMERSVVANIFQPKLAAYRQLPVLQDPDLTVKPGLKEDMESPLTPILERFWAFSCALTRGYTSTCMAWNKKNQDLLAVGYGDCDYRSQKPGLICCWSLKNLLRPERVFYCQSSVTSLDFSGSNPNQLAVGMYNGTIAIYNVQIQDSKACVTNSSECSKKHMRPVWQVIWTEQESLLSGAGKEALVSVSEDGRIVKWFLCNDGLDCIDLMQLTRVQESKKNAGNKKKKEYAMSVRYSPCIDFHPTDFCIYLAGTCEGLIHKCSFTNSQHFLDTYQKQLSPVNHIEWSPFSRDVFLSCSADSTIKLWKQDRVSPMLSFASIQSTLYTAKWSPKWSTVFAAITTQQVEIWDLNANLVFPTIVHTAPLGVELTSLLFATRTDCVLVGDSEGQVTIYKLKNLNVGESKQVKSLDDFIQAQLKNESVKV